MSENFYRRLLRFFDDLTCQDQDRLVRRLLDITVEEQLILEKVGYLPGIRETVRRCLLEGSMNVRGMQQVARKTHELLEQMRGLGEMAVKTLFTGEEDDE